MNIKLEGQIAEMLGRGLVDDGNVVVEGGEDILFSSTETMNTIFCGSALFPRVLIAFGSYLGCRSLEPPHWTELLASVSHV